MTAKEVQSRPIIVDIFLFTVSTKDANDTVYQSKSLTRVKFVCVIFFHALY